ncbi:uncharacterized protein LOC125531383 isoform X3 [Triticum urartu]|uniref:uncharacterized protein LOC125531383 isoform X3 n=1 Tax=Triticum urartu TaxID=4572 RepID=UPI002044225F|nr:uncharacterized protein LOC125531383 isoform X3 [Triticum urartu]
MSPLPDNLRRAPNAASRHFLSGQHRGQLPRHRLLARFLKQRRLIQELLPSAAPPPLGASSTNQSSKLHASSLSSPPSSVDYAIFPQVVDVTSFFLNGVPILSYVQTNLMILHFLESKLNTRG